MQLEYSISKKAIHYDQQLGKNQEIGNIMYFANIVMDSSKGKKALIAIGRMLSIVYRLLIQ
ncbi:MAG: hypothetical protein C6W54_13235 [Bacillaceae bacterium]|nr:MAG: hypothetical protein C6W54_13235 [Bacillaceae bacterium]